MEWLKIPILNNEYYVIVCVGQPKEVMKFTRKHFEDKEIPEKEFTDDTRGKSFSRKGYPPLLYIKLKSSDTDFFGTLAHEAVHAVQNIWEIIGEENHGEVFAYSVGAIVRETARFIKKKAS